MTLVWSLVIVSDVFLGKNSDHAAVMAILSYVLATQ